MPTLTTPRRVLASPLVDVLLGPHGVDRYLELIQPALTIHDARARVLDVRHQTPRSVTVTVEPNAAWRGFTAGQYVPVGVEIDGVRQTRTLSPASPPGARELEFTVTAHPQGQVSRHLKSHLRRGDVLHLGAATGDFVLPEPRPRRLALISGGSGITPVMSMLRALCDEGHDGEIAFVHYARTQGDWLYRDAVRALAGRHPGLRVHYVATREGGERAGAPALAQMLGGEIGDAHAAVCGPPSLIEAVQAVWATLPGGAERVAHETFTPLRLPASAPGEGSLHFTRSGRTVPVAAGSLLEQAEAAGLTPAFGCRMGICHTCTCRKAAGAVRNLRTGEVSEAEDEDIQLCISAPAGDVALEL